MPLIEKYTSIHNYKFHDEAKQIKYGSDLTLQFPKSLLVYYRKFGKHFCVYQDAVVDILDYNYDEEIKNQQAAEIYVHLKRETST